jgi:hypothetical protein
MKIIIQERWSYSTDENHEHSEYKAVVVPLHMVETYSSMNHDHNI